MVFTTNRALHSRGVSILMKRLTPIMNVELHRNGVKSRLDADEMALVGWVHDFGYLLDEDPDAHAAVMGRLMDKEDMPYSMVVARHGDPRKLYTPVDLMLNVCDMSIDGSGRLVTLDMRIQDVIDRWGVDHWRVDGVKRMKGAIEASTYWPSLRGTIHEMPEFPDHEQLTN